MNNREVLEYIVAHNGLYGSIDLLQEECAELIQACSKFKRATGHGLKTKVRPIEAIGSIIEEIADVKVAMEETVMALRIGELQIAQEIEFKIDRARNDILMEEQQNEGMPGSLSDDE